MTIRFDDKAKCLTLSVRDVVDVAHPVGGPGSIWMRLGSLTAGQVAHRMRQTAQSGEAGYRSERPVAGGFKVRGYDVRLRGRIDGVRREGERVVVEEIKSVFAASGQLASLGPERVRPFARQLQIYALLVAMETGADVTGELALVSLVDHRTVVVPVACDLGETREFLGRVLDQLVAKRLEEIERLEARRAVREIPFPYDRLRPQQAELVERLRKSLAAGRRALVSAPAGVGKTAAVFVAVLEWAYARDKRAFFLTSKTTQQLMAAETLKAMAERGLPLKAVVLAAHEKMCLADPSQCSEDACPYARDFFRRAVESDAVGRLLGDGVVEPRPAREYGEELRLCPFVLSMQAAGEADVVVCDYNYAFHPTVQLEKFFGEGKAEEAVVVVDEAHNLYGRAMEYFSPELASGEVREVAAILGALDGGAPRNAQKALLELSEWLTSVAESRGYDGVFMETSFDGPELGARKEKLDWAMFQYFGWRGRTQEGSLAEAPAYSLYYTISEFVTVAASSGVESSHIIKPDPAGPVFKVFCKDPSARLARTLNRVAGAVAMSATLEPLEFFRQVLGFDEEQCDRVRVGSPFPPENRMVVLAPWVDTRFRRRAHSYPDVAELVRRLSVAHRGNIMVFVPSYRYGEELAEHLDDSLELIFERPGSGDRARGDILDRLARKDGPPVAVVAVAGGSLAEGVDYPGRMCECVVVVGPALPRVSHERDLIRDYYDEMGLDGFAYAYTYPGMIRVVQSAGRLIRDSRDRGVLVLADRRFAESRYRRLMPPDWIASLVEPGQEDFPRLVRRFWEEPSG